MKPPPRLEPPARGADLAWAVRSGMIESVHAGHLLAVAADGSDVLVLGEPDQQIYARSSLKPLQTVAILRTGVELTGEQIALACASHNGEGRHREVVRGVLTAAGLAEADLRNTPDWPLDADAAAAWRDAGRAQEPIAQNCSGKHAAMLASCVHSGWDLDSYTSAEHPLQQHIVAMIAELSGEEARFLAVDGCGAPQPSTTVRGLARAFARIATAPAGTAEYRVAAAMRAHPFLVAGTGRDATAAMESVPGLIAKDGAEGVYAAALPDGRAVALKVADGASRPRPVLLAAALRALGERGHWPWSRVQVLGHGEPVGSVLPAFGVDGGAPGAPPTSPGHGDPADSGSAVGATGAHGSGSGPGSGAG